MLSSRMHWSCIALLSSKYLCPSAAVNALLRVDFVLIEHVLDELSKSNDLQTKEDCDKHEVAQDSGLLFDTTWLSLPDI